MTSKEIEKEKIEAILGQVIDDVRVDVDEIKSCPIYLGWERRPSQHTNEPEPEPIEICVDYRLRIISLIKAKGDFSELSDATMDDMRRQIEVRIDLDDDLKKRWVVRSNSTYIPWKINWQNLKNIRAFDEALNQFAGKNRISLADALNDQQRWDGLEAMNICSMHSLAVAVYIMSIPKIEAYEKMNLYLCRPEKYKDIYQYLGGQTRYPFFTDDLAKILSALTDLDEFLSFLFVSKIARGEQYSWSYTELDKKLSPEWIENIEELAKKSLYNGEYMAVAQRLCSKLDVRF